MSFAVAASSYDQFMGRYSQVLAPLFADFAGVGSQVSVLEVGCGPGALTGVLVERLGAASVTAIDPSEPFVTAMRDRFPDVETHQGSAESLPFPDYRFGAALAQLVVHHMADPVAGVREMARVTRPGGVIAACVWDHVGRRSPLGAFWTAYQLFDPDSEKDVALPGTREGELMAIFQEAGVGDVEGEPITFEYKHNGFEDWWAPFDHGVGPVGRIMADLDDADRSRLEALSREVFPSDSETLELRVWTARGTAAASG